MTIDTLFTNIAEFIGQSKPLGLNRFVAEARKAFSTIPGDNEGARNRAILLAKALTLTAGLPTRININDAGTATVKQELMQYSSEASEGLIEHLIEDIIAPCKYLTVCSIKENRDTSVNGGPVIGREYHVRQHSYDYPTFQLEVEF